MGLCMRQDLLTRIQLIALTARGLGVDYSNDCYFFFNKFGPALIASPPNREKRLAQKSCQFGALVKFFRCLQQCTNLPQLLTRDARFVTAQQKYW